MFLTLSHYDRWALKKAQLPQTFWKDSIQLTTTSNLDNIRIEKRPCSFRGVARTNMEHEEDVGGPLVKGLVRFRLVV